MTNPQITLDRTIGRKRFVCEYFQELGRRYDRPTIPAVQRKQRKYVTCAPVDRLTNDLYDIKHDAGELEQFSEDALLDTPDSGKTGTRK